MSLGAAAATIGLGRSSQAAEAVRSPSSSRTEVRYCSSLSWSRAPSSAFSFLAWPLTVSSTLCPRSSPRFWASTSAGVPWRNSRAKSLAGEPSPGICTPLEVHDSELPPVVSAR